MSAVIVVDGGGGRVLSFHLGVRDHGKPKPGETQE